MRVILAFCILLVTTVAYADFYVLVDKASKEIINFSDDSRNFVNVQANMEVKKFDGRLEDIGIDGDIQDYKVSGNRILINTKKISDRQADIEKKASDAQVKENKKKDAIDKLKGLGLKDDEIESLIN